MQRRCRPRSRPLALLVCVGALGSAGNAHHRTDNFHVTAPTAALAREVAAAAERHRKELAVLWLGAEMPRWAEPCAIAVDVTLGGAAGSTTFTFHADGG